MVLDGNILWLVVALTGRSATELATLLTSGLQCGLSEPKFRTYLIELLIA